ncbi:MAG: T9SS type A sorting domain-containing protein [Ignavibacteria bacterium]|nr:T9SS type A sorting domain-containing protein [Ignavibacteria bacterium]
MTIDSKTGEITWTPALTDTTSKNQIITHIKDLKNNILKDTFVVDVTKKNFYFVAKNGNNSNNGSEASPWATMAYASATADSSSYVYFKKGKYSESAFTIASKNCGRFMAYPGDTVVVNSTSSQRNTINISGGSKRLFQGFNFDGNGLRWLFSVDGYAKNLIWRNNTIHNVGDGGSENPAGMFFWNGSGNPITGGNSYDKIVVQDNIFYDLNGSSIVSFDVKNMLFENNIVHDIPNGPGNGVSDKDMGYMNTFRGNLIYNCQHGIVLMTQGGQSNIEVCYNHIYGQTGVPIIVGMQAGYINDVFIHHNTVLGNIKLYGYEIDRETSYNINIYKNIIGKGVSFPYYVSGVNNAYPSGFFSKVSVDSNIVYGLSNGTNVSGYSYGIPNLSWSQWQGNGQDLNSKYMQLKFDSDNIPILPDSLKIYGHFGNDYSKVTDIKMGEDENLYRKEYSLSQNYPNPFNPSTTIKFRTPLNSPLYQRGETGGLVTLKIFDILGREVTTLVNEHKPAGTYTVEWNGTNSAGQQVGSGVYFYQLKTGSGLVETKKMILLQ